MAIPQTTVNGRVALPNDANPTSGVVKFKLSGIDHNAATDAVILSTYHNADIDANTGNISIDLFPNGEGGYGTHYVATATAYTNDVAVDYPLGIVVVPSSGPVDLNDLLQVVTPSDPTTAEYAALLAAAVASAEAAATAAAASAAAASADGLTPEEHGAVGGPLFDADTRAILDDIDAQGTLYAPHAHLIDKTMRRFKSARIDSLVTATSVSQVVTFTQTGATATQLAAFDWINDGYELERSGLVTGGDTITAAEMDAAEAINVTANTTAMQNWLNALEGTAKVGFLPAKVYPVNDTLKPPSGTVLNGVEWRSTIRMVDGVDQLRPVIQIGDKDDPRRNISITRIVVDGNVDRITAYANDAARDAALAVVDSNLPDNEDIRGTAFAVCYTSDSYFDKIFALDAYRHCIDIAGGRDGRSGTVHTYLPMYQPSKNIRVGTVYGQGAGDDAFTCHNVDGLTVKKVNGYFATAVHVNNGSGCEIDDLSTNVTIGDVDSYFCYTTAEIKGHADSNAANNVHIKGRVYGLYCTNGLIIRHISHGDTIGATASYDPDNLEVGQTPQSDTAKNVTIGNIVIENPLEWIVGNTRQALRIYAYEKVFVKSLQVDQIDAADDYYKVGTGSEAVFAMFWSARDVDVGPVHINGFPGSTTGVRVTATTLGVINVGPVIINDSPLYGVFHTGGSRFNLRAGYDLERTTATTGSYGIRSLAPHLMTDGGGRITGYERTKEGLNFQAPSGGSVSRFMGLEKRYEFKADRDTGNHNVLQGFIPDEVNGYIYGSHITEASPEKKVINQYRLDGPINQASISFQNSSSDLRHQSLSLERLADGSVKLWSSSEVEREMLVRFDYTAGGSPANIEKFQVGDDTSDERIWNVDISKDQRILVAQTGTLFRIFDFQKMIDDGAGDYSTRYSTTWSLPDIISPQGFRIEGDYLYVVSGGATTDNNIQVVSLDGVMQDQFLDLQAGVADSALVSPGTDNEMENLFFKEDGSVALGLAQGAAGSFPGRTNRIYMRPAPAVFRPWCDEAETAIGGMTTPSERWKRDVNDWIVQAKEFGLWSDLGAFWFIGSPTSANAVVDWVRPGTNDLTLVGSPTFVANQGYTFNGSNTLLESTAAITTVSNFASGDAHMSVTNHTGESTVASGSPTDISIGNPASGNYLLRAMSTGGKVNVRFGKTSTSSPSGTVHGTAYTTTACRTSSTNVNCYWDGREYHAGSVTQTEDATATGKVYIGGRMVTATPSEVTTRTTAAASVGAALSRAQQADLRNLNLELLDKYS